MSSRSSAATCASTSDCPVARLDGAQREKFPDLWGMGRRSLRRLAPRPPSRFIPGVIVLVISREDCRNSVRTELLRANIGYTRAVRFRQDLGAAGVVQAALRRSHCVAKRTDWSRRSAATCWACWILRTTVSLVPGACPRFTDRLSRQGRQHPTTEPAQEARIVASGEDQEPVCASIEGL